MSQTISIIDDSLKSGLTLSHMPVIKFSASNIVYAILDTTSNYFVAFENRNYSDSKNISEEMNQSVLVKMLLENGTEKIGKTLVLIDNPVFTLVPDELFNPMDAKKYLSFTHSYQANEGIGIDKTDNINSHNVYWLPYDVNAYIDKRFLLNDYRHFTTIFLNYCFLINRHQDTVYVYASNSILYVAAIKKGKFILCNAYEYSTKEDMVFHTMNVFQKLEFNRQSIPLLLSGESGNLSEFKSIISGYIGKVNFLIRPSEYNYCKGMSEFPPYISSVLFGTFLCA